LAWSLPSIRICGAFNVDEFKDFPMRKDYVEPDDYEYEPTPHDEILEKAQTTPGGRR